MFTLDSNVLIAYLNGDKKVVEQLMRWRNTGARFFISAITEVEVLALPHLTRDELRKIDRFLKDFTVIPVDSQLARLAAHIRRNRKINLGDSVIVATAQLTNSALVTLDRELLKKAKNLIRLYDIK
jgi:predicted nucleic acid-binding protein